MNSAIEKDELVWNINPEDECAVELAVQLSEQLSDVSTTVLRVGQDWEQESLITAMAMGIDQAILVEAAGDLDPIRTAKALKGAIKSSAKQPDLILCGTTAADYDNHQVPQLLAMLLGMPAISGVVSCDLDGSELTIGRQIEAGVTEVYKSATPLLLACSYGMNVPRYAALPHIKRARQKPLVRLSLSEAGVTDTDQRLRYFNYRRLAEKPAGRVFDTGEDRCLSEVINEAMTLVDSEIKSIRNSK